MTTSNQQRIIVVWNDRTAELMTYELLPEAECAVRAFERRWCELVSKLVGKPMKCGAMPESLLQAAIEARSFAERETGYMVEIEFRWTRQELAP